MVIFKEYYGVCCLCDVKRDTVGVRLSHAEASWVQRAFRMVRGWPQRASLGLA